MHYAIPVLYNKSIMKLFDMSGALASSGGIARCCAHAWSKASRGTRALCLGSGNNRSSQLLMLAHSPDAVSFAFSF